MIYWDPKPEAFTVPWVHWPILWYGLLFALGFIVGFPLFVSILTRFFQQKEPLSDASLLKKRAVTLTDRLTVYMVVGTIVGARLGHYLFYERPADYLRDPWGIFRIWEGGLASHGGVVGILIAVALFHLRIRKAEPLLTPLRLLDFLAVPAAFASCCIRLGNFVNQEILGKPTDLPWAVVFGHPADGGPVVPRHPVQLYEALFYLGVFFVLWRLSYQKLAEGRLAGLLLVWVFTFRFFVEFLKEEQSRLIGDFGLTMGQILSLPVIVVGVVLWWRGRV